MKYFALLGALLVVVVGCGSKDHATPYVGPSGGGSGGRVSSSHAGAGGKNGTSGSGGSDAGEAGEAGAAGAPGDENPLAPVVQISSPGAVSDPDNGKVLTGSEVTVTCSATKSPEAGAQPVLGSSIKIQMLGADGKQIGKDGAVMSTSNANEYSALFVLTGVPSGVVSFTCSASDESTSVVTGTATINTFYDAGPIIAITDPADKSAHPLGAVQFKFSALPNVIATGDQDAGVDKVTLKVDGVDITDFSPVTGTPGYYQTSIDLNSPIKFPSPPVGSVSVVITATNKRGTTATSNTTFVVDSTGPLITIVSPPTVGAQFVTGQVVLIFTVEDEVGGSGVNPDTVAVKVNTGDPVPYKEGNSWHLADDRKTFTYAFSVKDTSVNTQVGVSIDAYDSAGNKAKGASASYYVDTVPPIIDMDPPLLQEFDSTSTHCSELFDPLGDSPNDLAPIQGTDNFRALVWDEGNFIDSKNGIVFFSDVDATAGVRLYFQEDVSKPLLKSDVPGAVCNQIADLTLPFANLVPIAPAGAAYFDSNAPTPGFCTKGGDTIPPKQLCNQKSALTRVIQHEVATTTAVAVVYGLQGLTDSLCTGAQLDMTTKVTKDGWVCAAVAAQDKLGNASVSAPIRLCLDALAYPGTPACAEPNPPDPPTCVPAAPNGCTAPVRFTETLITKP
jgi:hypothetical protein